MHLLYFLASQTMNSGLNGWREHLLLIIIIVVVVTRVCGPMRTSCLDVWNWHCDKMQWTSGFRIVSSWCYIKPMCSHWLMTPTMVIRCFGVVFRKMSTTINFTYSCTLCVVGYFLLFYENDSTFSTTENVHPSHGLGTKEMTTIDFHAFYEFLENSSQIIIIFK